ncbi:30S ribosomal protein S11 [Candidatus Parcubacteria bacterium]|nr:30S ribosomal protein S11 [Candidatus Parcubacteria bacterium]
MGKKRIIAKSEEELIKERDAVDNIVKKDKQTKAKIRTQNGRVYIASSYNNTLITLTDVQGNVLAWSSAGTIGFKGSKKATPFAASKVVETVAKVAEKIGIKEVHVLVKGIGGGRESAIRSLAAKGLQIMSIEDVTPIPHNGCRPKKPRRV